MGKEGQSIEGIREESRRRERSNSVSMVELWAQSERKEEEEGNKRMKQKEKEYDEIFKKSKLVEGSPNNRENKKNGRGDGLNELITIMKELKKEMADLRKEIREMKEGWKTIARSLEKRMDTMKEK